MRPALIRAGSASIELILPLDFPAEIEFVKDPDGKVSALILHQGGRDMKAPRK